MENTKKKAVRFLCISLALVLISMIGVSLVQTNAGHVEVKEMYWETEAGIGVSANIYIPDTATIENPAPAVVTSHGYLNNKDMQDSNSVELSRRGYVVIAVDQPGCGQSDIADWQGQNGNGMNFIAVSQAVSELGRLPFVDKERIGVTGHSMGGMSCNFALYEDLAREEPLISAIMLNCIDALYTDSPNTIGGVAAIAGGDGQWVNMYGSRDVGIIACQYDEFFHQTLAEDGSVLQAPHFMEVSQNAQSFLHFGADPEGLERREAGVIYHEDVDGEDTIRVIYNPGQIHPWSHFSKRSETATLTFFKEAFGFPKDIAPTSQIWQLKETLNFVGMVGFVMFIVAFGTLMLYTPTFEELRAGEIATASKCDKKGIMFYIGWAVISTAIGALTYHKVVEFGKGMTFAEQPMIFGIALWACLNGIISIAGLVIGQKLCGAGNGVDLVESGVKMPVKKLLKTILLAVIVIAVSYSLVFIAHYCALSDFRIWNVGIKYVNANTLRMAIWPHAFLFMVFYIAFSVANNSFNFNQIGGKHSWLNNFVLTLVAMLPIIILLGIQYLTYRFAGHMAFSDNNAPMNVAQLWAFLIMIPGAAVVDRLLYKVTKNPYLPGIITGVIIAIISSANTTSVLPM